MSLRQVCLYEYLARYNYTINYVEGIRNVVADALSRMHVRQNDSVPIDEWVISDVHLDPEGETLPIDRFLESRAMQLRPCGTNEAVLKERQELRIKESQRLREAAALLLSNPPDFAESIGYCTRANARNRV